MQVIILKKEFPNRIYVHENFIYVNNNKIDIIRKDVNGIEYMFDAIKGDRIIVNHKYRNLYMVKGMITQMLVIYKDTFKLTTFDTKDLRLVLQNDWIYKHDINGGGIYCTKEKKYLHYYLYDPDKSYRDLRHKDNDRLNNVRFNIALVEDRDTLPVGVYYNEKSEIYYAEYTFEGETYDRQSFKVSKLGNDKARANAIECRKLMEKRYKRLGIVKDKPKKNKKNKDSDGWV